MFRWNFLFQDSILCHIYVTFLSIILKLGFSVLLRIGADTVQILLFTLE